MAKKSNETRVKISSAKGRPMLNWVGKRPLKVVPALPAQHVETFDPSGDLGKKKPSDIWQNWPDGYPKGGLLFHGDNKEVLAHLLANGFRGKVNLIYIDPPFDSGADYVRKVQLRGVKGTAKIDGEGYTLGEQIQYTDIWANDNYLQFMYERLMLLKELLSENGSIFLHCDYRKAHYLKVLMDEVFGPSFFRANIVWRSMTSSGFKGKKSLGKSHADLLYYSKNERFTYTPMWTPYDEEYLKRFNKKDPDGRRFKDEKIGSATSKQTIEKLKAENKIYVTSKGTYRIKHYFEEAPGILIDDVWTDIRGENSQSLDLTGYPTQKPTDLLTRLIKMFSNSADIILDCFLGSGTTAAVAQKLGRRWIGCDINTGAIQGTSKRLQSFIAEQIKEKNKPKQKRLKGMEDDSDNSPEPAQLDFTVWRVNDYDLQIQHNEAVNLACEYIGVERIRGDVFFDGTLGKKLVKIIPFNHPLTPLDLEELKKELNSRPDEDRDITLVSLGMELAAQKWLDDWNRHRKGGAPNRINVIELRTDPKYAGFIKHDPATAKISIKWANDRIKVKIKDFISPTIVKRLDMEQNIFKAKIKDWRSMVDCVMIDPAYNGDVFNVTISDVPGKKTDFVSGDYDFPAPDGKTIVAVKIIDMLGEEVLMTKEI